MPRQRQLWVVDRDSISSFCIRRQSEILCLGSFREFSDSSSVLELLSHHSHEGEKLPDIILLDLYLSISDEWRFLTVYSNLKKQLVKKPKIFIFSSSTHEKDVIHAKSFRDVEEYMIKPIKDIQLKAIIDE